MYEDFYQSDSPKNKNSDFSNFDIGSHNAMDENNISQTVGSGKKGEENNSSNPINIMPEGQDIKIKKDDKNSQTHSKIAEIPIPKKIQKEKEQESSLKRNSLHQSFKINNMNINNNNINADISSNIHPVLKKREYLDVDNEKNYNTKSNLNKEDIDSYLNKISQLQEDNMKLKKYYEEEWEKEKKKLELLDLQHQKDLEDIRINTENKIKDFSVREELIKENFKKFKQDLEDKIKKEEDNIKQINQKKLEIKKKELNYQIELINKKNKKRKK